MKIVQIVPTVKGLVLLLLAAILAGCAGSSDLVTASDESEARRRARIRLELAASYFDLGQTTVALDETKQALAIDPRYADAHNLRGLIYMRLGQARLADDSFRRALDLSDNAPDVLHNYGWFLCQQGRHDAGVQHFRQALAQPAYAGEASKAAAAKTWLSQGLCQLQAGQPHEARASLLKAHELDAANPVTGYNLARLFYESGDLQRARLYIQRINAGALANAETLWLGVKIEQRLGNQAGSEQLAGQLRSRHPDSREFNSYERRAFHE